MSAPKIAEPVATPPETPEWDEADVTAALESAFWFHSNITDELIAPYRGTHVAILDKQIIDADRDKDALFRRLDTRGDAVPPARLVIRYIPTDEESLRLRS